MAAERGTSKLEPTLSQTVGPFFHLGLAWLFDERVAEDDASGQHITIRGRVLDGDGAPVSDALLEIWQADASGRYPNPLSHHEQAAARRFKGCARVATDDSGAFRFMTVKPGRVPAPNGGLQAPHISVQLFMRGLLRPLLTRIYFADEPSNSADLVLEGVPATRRHTLLANRQLDGALEWNVVLQGSEETVFFDG